MVLVSDNGPGFRADITAALAKMLGYRHIFILPYNAPANGIAEAGVKRIKLLLDRQTDGYADWHKLLPLSQLLLNTTVHSGTGVSSFMALFGREPFGLEHLENPALLPAPSSGDEFLLNLRTNLIHLHAELQRHSDAIKLARTQEETARKYARLSTSRHGVIHKGGYVWVIHGSHAQADFTRKHGHGTPWKHRYKVLEIKPHAVLLEIPADSSVPKISPWQHIRKVSPADDLTHDATPTSPRITELGIPLSSIFPPMLSPMDGDGDLLAPDDDLYEIESIHHAEKVGRYYRIWITWKGFAEPSWRWRHQLVREIGDPMTLQAITDAVDAARARRLLEAPSDTYEDDPDDASYDGLNAPLVHVPLSLSARPSRIHAPPQRYTPSLLPILPSMTRCDTKCLHVVCDYFKALAHAHTFFLEDVI